MHARLNSIGDLLLSFSLQSLGLGLLPPTPPVSFELRDPSQANDIKISEHISRRVAAPGRFHSFVNISSI